VRELDQLVRRLRGLSTRAWRGNDRVGVVRRLADDLVALGGEGHSLPDVPDYALADVIAVVGADALAADPVGATDLISRALAELS
jgi:predicted amino acid-binding ACT domain protein